MVCLFTASVLFVRMGTGTQTENRISHTHTDRQTEGDRMEGGEGGGWRGGERERGRGEREKKELLRESGSEN